MTTLYLANERIPLKIDDLTVEIVQLNQSQKMVLLSLLSNVEINPSSGYEAARKAIQYCVKSIKGIQLSDGSDYEVEIVDGKLTDDCVDTLMNLRGSSKFQAVCLSLLQGFSGECTDVAGQPIPGVSLIKSSAPKKGKKPQG